MSMMQMMPHCLENWDDDDCNELQDDLNEICDWSKEWEIKVNEKKTKMGKWTIGSV